MEGYNVTYMVTNRSNRIEPLVVYVPDNYVPYDLLNQTGIYAMGVIGFTSLYVCICFYNWSLVHPCSSTSLRLHWSLERRSPPTQGNSTSIHKINQGTNINTTRRIYKNIYKYINLLRRIWT